MQHPPSGEPATCPPAATPHATPVQRVCNSTNALPQPFAGPEDPVHGGPWQGVSSKILSTIVPRAFSGVKCTFSGPASLRGQAELHCARTYSSGSKGYFGRTHDLPAEGKWRGCWAVAPGVNSLRVPAFFHLSTAAVADLKLPGTTEGSSQVDRRSEIEDQRVLPRVPLASHCKQKASRGSEPRCHPIMSRTRKEPTVNSESRLLHHL